MQKDKEKTDTYLLRSPVTLSDVVTLLQELEHLCNGGFLLTELLHLQSLTATSRLLAQSLQSLLDKLDILDAQFLVDDGQIPDGVDVTLDVNDLGVIEASDDLEDGIDGTDVRQEGVTQAGTGGGTAGQTGDIVDRQVGRDLRLGLVVFAQPIVSVIRNDNARLFGVDGGIGEVGRVTQRRLCDGLEQCRFTDVGQTNLSRGREG